MHRILPVVLSCYLMAAHHLRYNQLPLTLIWMVIPCLLFVKRAWVARGFQAAMAFAAGMWIYTALGIASARMSNGEPWMRMALILGGVALFTGLSALGFQTGKMKRRYRLDAEADLSPQPD